MPLTSMAQDDDLYFNPKKEAKKEAEERVHERQSCWLPSVHVKIAYTLYLGAEATEMWMNTTVAEECSAIIENVGTDSLGNDIIPVQCGQGRGSRFHL